MIASRVVLALLLAFATAVVALAQLNLPDRRFWQIAPAVAAQWASVALMAAFILINEFRVVSQLARAKSIREYDADLGAVLTSTLYAVVEASGAKWDELTVCYYRARGLWRWRRLRQVASLAAGRVSTAGQQSVRPGVGVVGVAFLAEEIIAEDWETFTQTALDEGLASWNKRRKLARYGLNWGQVRRAAKDRGVIVSPLVEEQGRPIGCVMISGPLKLPDLTHPSMRRILGDLETVLDHLGPPPAGWWRAHEI